MDLKEQITIRVAETEAEKLAAYQLRYQVFSEELGDDRYANHESKEFRDSDDVESSVQFIAVAENSVIGAVRLKLLKDHEFIGLEAYNLPKLAKLLNRSIEDLYASIGCMDRGVVHPDYRGRRLIAKLMRRGEALAIKLGVDSLLSAAEVGNTAARKAFAKIGYVEYFVGTHNGTTCQCIYKVLNQE